MFALDLMLIARPEAKCSTQVFKPFGPAEARLGCGITLACKGVDNTEASELSQAGCQFRGLVESSLSEPVSVEWDGDDHSVSEESCKPGVTQTALQYPAKLVREMNFATVFEIM